MDDNQTTERLIGLIIRDVCEIPRDPLPDQNPDHVLISVDELRAILEERLTNGGQGNSKTKVD